jgi:glycosyltransferase involved in cell wall biosynthesis
VKVLVVSGIWPPDVGGPASHAPDVADFLRARGHEVEAVVTADRRPAPRAYPVHWISRRVPKGVLHAVAAARMAALARRADVVYTTGMFARSAAAARGARRPYVVKLTGDPAFERARWRGGIGGDVDEFQRGGGGIQAGLLRRVRDATVHHASHVVCPSGYLAFLAESWGMSPDRVTVLPNPTPPIPELASRADVRRSLGVGDGPLLVFAGRFGPQKALDVALDAVSRLDDVTLVLAGDGEGRSDLEARATALGERVRFVGAVPRTRVLELFAAADAGLLSSSWENFPHTVVETLAVGTPVIATAVGGVAEVVDEGVNGLLVPPGDPEALAAAIARFFGDEELRLRLRAAAAASVTRFAPEVVYGELERILLAAVR